MEPIEPRVPVAPFQYATRRPDAVYERELDVSVERVWENVLDWEHLPFLHEQAFTSVAGMTSDADGWSGLVGLGGSLAEIDVRIDRDGLRYSTRTVAGLGAGSEILTTLLPRAPRQTGIRVEFHVPWAPEGAGEAIGAGYRAMYEVLWDQDEEMMKARQRVVDGAGRRNDGPASVALGRVEELQTRLPFDVELGGRLYRVASIDGRLVAFDTFCTHLGGPLALEGREAVCPWHGYRFDAATGEGLGPHRCRLRPPARVVVEEGMAVLALPHL